MQTRHAPGRGKAARQAPREPETQLTFDFATGQGQGKKAEAAAATQLLAMRRAVLGWLLGRNPAGIGVAVPTRLAKFSADVAAFWAAPDRRRLLQPTRTLAVEIRRGREQCWPDCARHEELLPRLKELKAERAAQEASIRLHEPHLKDTDSLFDEFGSWQYGQTANPDYARCLKRIEEAEHALYRGSRFEQIRRGQVADLLYLAVPAGAVHADELADGWGLLEIGPGFQATETRPAESWDCPRERRLHFVQNIAASCRGSLLFAHGIREGKNGRPVFTPVPRRRVKAVQ